MSAPDPADTVIEQFIAEEFAFQPASEVPLQAQRLRIRLHDAGLLADPADRDECVSCNGSGLYPNEVPGVGTEWLGCPDCDRAEVNHWKSNAERAEAEVAELVVEGIRQKRRANEAIARAARAEAEVARLQQWKDEAAPVMTGLQDLGRALGIPLGTRITGEVAAEKAAELRATEER